MPRIPDNLRPWRFVLAGISLLLVVLLLRGEEGDPSGPVRQEGQSRTTPEVPGDAPAALPKTPGRTATAKGVAEEPTAAATSTTERRATATRPAGDPGPTVTRAEVTPAMAEITTSMSKTPASPGDAVASPAFRHHVVQHEETLITIAAHYQVSVEAIVGANAPLDPHRLQIGQRLQIPPPLTATATPFAGRDFGGRNFGSRNVGYEIIGFSWEGRAIEVFSFGEGPQRVVLVGGIHGGYEWNTVLLAYQIIDYFNGYRGDIPPGLAVDIIPVANPDGLSRVSGSAGRFDPGQIGAGTTPGRFNGRGVDLNRNWGCHWSASAYWGPTAVKPGSGPFSEPETRALRAYLERIAPVGVVFWHSALNLVSAGRCGEDDAQATSLANTYGAAAGYPAGSFDAYGVTGGASDWLVSQGIPAVSVELAEHHLTEFQKNVAGVLAVLQSFGPAEQE